MGKLRKITVIFTAAGNWGAATCIRFLKRIKEREVKVVGVDVKAEFGGRFLADDYAQIPLATDEKYTDALLDVAIEKNVDCVLITSSHEVEAIAPEVGRFEDHGVKVLVSSPESLKIANNKRRLYELLRDEKDVKIPEFKVVSTLDNFVQVCREMGYPKRKLCFKPPFSAGSRGFRYLVSGISEVELLLKHKPDNKFITLDNMIRIFEDEEDFPELLVMEHIKGEEIDSMVLALDGEELLVTHKTRETARFGGIWTGGHCERPEIEKSIRAILKKVPLSYNIGMQFKGRYLIEINPRLSTFLYTDEWNEPYFAIKLALGEYTPADVKKLQSKVPSNLRFVRHFEQCFYYV